MAAGIQSNSSAALQAGLSGLFEDDTNIAAFYTLPNGVHVLFQAALAQEPVDVLLNTAVTAVTADGTVVWADGHKHFDKVISAVPLEVAAAILPSQLGQTYEKGSASYVDLWIFNASVDASSEEAMNLLQEPFLALLTTDKGQPTPAGLPTYVYHAENGSSFYCAGSHVPADAGPNETVASAINTLLHYGIDVAGTVAHHRVQFPAVSGLPLPDLDSQGNVYVLSSALSGQGIATALDYVSNRLNAWFGLQSPA